MHGYLHNTKADKIMQQINVLSDLAPEEVPKDSRFLLEINFSELSSYHLETQKYWMLAVDAALKAKALESARGARAKRVQRKLNTKIPNRKKLGIAIVEQQIRKDGMHRAAAQPDVGAALENFPPHNQKNSLKFHVCKKKAERTNKPHLTGPSKSPISNLNASSQY